MLIENHDEKACECSASFLRLCKTKTVKHHIKMMLDYYTTVPVLFYLHQHLWQRIHYLTNCGCSKTVVCPEVPSSNLEFNNTRVKPYSNSCKEVFFNRWTLKGIKVTFKTRSERFSKTLESSNTIAIATVGDWAKKDLAPVFQPMRSKTKTNRPFNSCVLSCLAFV